MRIYTEGAPVALSVSFSGLQGVPVAPDSASATLQDEYGTVIADLGSVTLAPGATSAEILIPAIHNAIASGTEGLGVRALLVRYTIGPLQTSTMVSYGLEREVALQVCVNSFQTWPRAQVEAAQIINLTAFNVEQDDARRKFALIEAYNRIINLRLTYQSSANGEARWHWLDSEEWDLLTEDAFNTQLPSRLRRSLIHAQLHEANEILQGNVLARKIAAGIQSETIGESSVTLRPGAGGSSIGTGVSTFTMAVLAPFLDNTIKIGRA